MSIFEKIRKQSGSKKLGDFAVKDGEKVWYHNAPRYLLVITVTVPLPLVAITIVDLQSSMPEKIFPGRSSKL